MELFPYLRTLIVDENYLSMGSLRAHLDTLGFSEIDSADTVVAAGRFVAERSYDLIFVALEMSDVSGLDCLHNLRMQQRLSSTLIIATGITRFVRYQATAIQQGADLFLPRPTSIGALKIALVELLTGSTGRKAKIVPFKLGKEALRRSALVHS